MRFRLPLLTAALAAALALPGAAQGRAGAATPAAAATACADGGLGPTAANLGAVRAATLCLVNRERTQRGLRALRPVPQLDAVAAAYAGRMVRERFFDHTSPDGGSFLDRIKRTSYLRGGIRSWSVGENLAWGTGSLATPQAIVRAWMASPGHRANILNGAFTELGLAAAPGTPGTAAGRGAATYVNEFGARRRW